MSRPTDASDLYLLRVFSTLMDERSLARTATRLGRSRDAIANALRHLRERFDDPLLLRDGQHMVPTERALALEASLRLARGRLEGPMPQAPSQPRAPADPPEHLAPLLLEAAALRLRPSARHRGIGRFARWG